MKNVENFIFEKKAPQTSFSWNNIIYEDSKYKIMKLYTKDIFKNSKLFKIVNDDEEKNIAEIEKKKKEEESKKKLEKTYNKIDKLMSDIKSDTNQIKVDMELDAKKREEMKKKLEEDRIKKEKEEKERRIKEENERKEKERKEREEIMRRERERIINENKMRGSVKEKLIKAGNNFENIKNEIKKINNENNLKKKTNYIFTKIMEILPNITTEEDLDKFSKEINSLFKELKDNKFKELYIYTCFYILSKIKDILTSSELNYYDCFIKAKFIKVLNNKTLTYMFYQNICYYCPFIIPVKDFESIFIDKNTIQEKKMALSNNIKENCKRFTTLQYLYFIFLWLEPNKNLGVIEDYLNNMEKFKENEINYLIANSFLSMINVFGNYIKNNNNILMTKIKGILNKVKIGLKLERKNAKYSDIKSIIDKINNDLENNYKQICGNNNTKFLTEIIKINNK